MSNKKKNNNKSKKTTNRKPNSGQFKKGNQVGKETRFQKDNTLSVKYEERFCDLIVQFFQKDAEPTVYYEKTYYNNGSIKSEKPSMIVAPKLPTMEKFADSIGVSYGTLLNWCDNYPRFKDSYARAMTLQKSMIITNGLSKHYDSNLSKFLLTNNHGMTEQTKSDVTYKVVIDGEIDGESN